MAFGRARTVPLAEVAEELRVYSIGARQVCHNNAVELEEAARDLRRVLKPIVGWRRSLLVVIPMKWAGDHSRHGAAHAAAAWIAFLREFAPETFANVRIRNRRRNG